VAEALRESIAATRCSSLADRPLPITVSIGLQEFDPRGDRDGDDLINDADQALYRAKAKGRNRVEVFEKEAIAALVNASEAPESREGPADQRSSIR
jgi:diguanylate cyclase (GGDEF)-like protein